MQFDEAMKIISMACAAFQGNLQDHQTIQKALAVVNDAGQKGIIDPMQVSKNLHQVAAAKPTEKIEKAE